MESANALTPMLEARRIAVVGATPRPGSVGDVVYRQARRSRDEVYAVNPRYDSIGEARCYQSIGDIGEPVDLAVLAVPDRVLEESLAAAIEAGARAAAIFGPCRGAGSDGAPLPDTLGSMASAARIPVCGGNGMGFVNVEAGLTVCGFHQPAAMTAGSVTLLTHSGSFFSAVLHASHRIDFNLVVSTGNEMATTMDVYLDHAVDMDSTRVVGIFLETIRDPEAFAEALDRAVARDLPVVALKVGKTERGRAAVATHTAAIAGDHQAFSAFLLRHGVHLADSPEELVDTLELFSAGRRPGPGHLGSVHDSGGERTLLIDAAESNGVELARIGATTADRLRTVLEEGLEPENPVDAWGTGSSGTDAFEGSVLALADDPEVAVLAYAVDLTPEEDDHLSYVASILRTAEKTTKPVAVLATLGAAVDAGQAAKLRAEGVPVLGSVTGLLAVKHLLAHRDRRPHVAPTIPGIQATAWTRRLTSGIPLDEADSLDLLADFGVPVIPHRRCTTREDVAAAVGDLGLPVALKVSGIDHKTDVGAVRLSLVDMAGLDTAFTELSRIGPTVVVEPMAEAGLEIAVGILVDDQFGPVLVVAAGGVLVDAMSDAAAAIAPVDDIEATTMLESLTVGRLFRGHRGRGPFDIVAAARAVAGISRVGAALHGVIDGIDVNPLIVSESGAVAVDALVVPRAAPGPDNVTTIPEGDST